MILSLNSVYAEKLNESSCYIELDESLFIEDNDYNVLIENNYGADLLEISVEDNLTSDYNTSQYSSLVVCDEDYVVIYGFDDNLIDRGATVIVIEHDLDLIANTDHIIDIGIDNENCGGEILAIGSLNHVINSPKSLRVNI